MLSWSPIGTSHVALHFLLIWWGPPSNSPAWNTTRAGTTLNPLLCNNTHIHMLQTLNCFSHSPPRPAFVLSHLQNKTVLEISLQITSCLPNPPGSAGNQSLGSPCPHRDRQTLASPHFILYTNNGVVLLVGWELFHPINICPCWNSNRSCEILKTMSYL